MNETTAGVRQINPSVFEAAGVDVNVMLLYLAIDAVGTQDRQLAVALRQALKEKGLSSDRHGFVQQALSGMPDAIVPFRRQPQDIYLAAAIMRDISRAGFRGDGNYVDAGYFSSATGELKYVDTVNRIYAVHQEVVNPSKAAELISRLKAWPTQPTVEIGDATSEEILRLRPGIERAPKNDEDLPEFVRVAAARNEARRSAASLNLLQVEFLQDNAGDSTTTVEVRQVAMARAHMPIVEDALVMGSLEAEALMEMQAAVLNAQEIGASLWLVIERHGNKFLAPMPDLMEPGSLRSGWWVPMRQISVSLGGSPDTTAQLPRWAVMRLMRQLPWFGVPDPFEWVRCAWWIQQRGADAVYGVGSGSHSQQELPHIPGAMNATASPLKRLGWLFGLSA